MTPPRARRRTPPLASRPHPDHRPARLRAPSDVKLSSRRQDDKTTKPPICRDIRAIGVASGSACHAQGRGFESRSRKSLCCGAFRVPGKALEPRAGGFPPPLSVHCLNCRPPQLETTSAGAPFRGPWEESASLGWRTEPGAAPPGVTQAVVFSAVGGGRRAGATRGPRLAARQEPEGLADPAAAHEPELLGGRLRPDPEPAW